MLGPRFTIGRVLGIPIRLDASWFLVLALISWSLATAFFPAKWPAIAESTRWVMGLGGALGLFGSILLHELAHSVVALHYGIPIRSITLFIFGGVAELEREPPHPKAELLIAAAGPALSLALGLVLLGAAQALRAAGVGDPTFATLFYLGLANGILAVFNCVPAFPLDGGRMLRAALWWRRGSLRSATRTTAGIGSGFGAVLMGLGVAQLLVGSVVMAIWYFLLGLFVRSAAAASYQSVVIRQLLSGETVRRFMTGTPVRAVEPSMTVERLVEDIIYRYHHKLYPVLDGDRLVGSVGTREVKALPREEWPHTEVAAIAVPLSEETTIEASTDALAALGRMQSARASRLLVVDQGQLVGIVALKDLLELLQLKAELAGELEPGA